MTVYAKFRLAGIDGDGERYAEAIWGRIDQIDDDLGTARLEISNEPACSGHGFKRGDTVTVRKSDIMDITTYGEQSE